MSDRPNILLLLSDGHAPLVSGFAGDSVVRTPNLDKLAGRGVHFTRAYCSDPVCTPSRMCMMTGKDVHNCSAWSNHWVIFPEHKTWPQHFADHAYATCLVGKMHFGGKDQMQGFQFRPYGDLRHGLGHQPDPLAMYPGYGLASSAGVTEIPESLLQENVVTRETLAFIREHEAEHPDQPWFTCASYSRPHAPLTAPKRYLRRYRERVPRLPTPGAEWAADEAFLKGYQERPGNRLATDEIHQRASEAYYACIDFLDDCIGELLEPLEREGRLENTIVIYTSDHGELGGLHGCWGKSLYLEPSVGVPLIVAGPGVDSGGTACGHPVSLLDLFPTTSAWAGLPVVEGIDGVNLSACWQDPAEATRPREYVFSANYLYGIRVKGTYETGFDPGKAWRLVFDGRLKYVEIEDSGELLFDLESDPGESTNLAAVSALIDEKKRLHCALHDGFSWSAVHEQIRADRERLPEFLSGHRPGTPNQYQLPDGRIFDAEKELYDARWLPIQPGSNGGIIPQQFG